MLLYAGIALGIIVLVLAGLVVARGRRTRKLDCHAEIIVHSGAQTGRRFRLEKAGTTIGSQNECDLVLTDDRVSRHHLLLVYERGAFTAVDLNSLHGTFVGGRRIEREALSSGGRINLGKSVDLEFILM
jgi:pSer/pThr/pTyr-binding forkhead associated (FHA) protein